MRISTLDQMLPKHWSLLLRYYLPFFKKPDPFYFKCREFVNDLKKKTTTQDLPSDKIFKFINILEIYSKNNPELVEFSKKIIDTIEEEQLQSIKSYLLEKVKLKRYRNNNQSPVLNELFDKLRATNQAHHRQTNFVSIPITPIKNLRDDTKKLDVNARFNFLKTSLIENNINDTKKALQTCPVEQWPELIDKLLNYYLTILKNKETFSIKALKENDFCSQVLCFILDSYKKSNEQHPINIMQFLAITALLNSPIDLEEISKISMESKFKENLTIELQEYLAENRIKAIKDLIKQDYILKIKKYPRHDCIHRKFHNFYIDSYLIGNYVEELNSIILKLPELTQKQYKSELNIIQKLFSFIYELLTSPLVRELKNKRLLTDEKDRIDYERLAEERRELTKRIGMNAQCSVSHQRMEELFGKEKAIIMKDKWLNIGVTFFDANNRVERQAAMQEAAVLKEILNEKFEVNPSLICSTSRS